MLFQGQLLIIGLNGLMMSRWSVQIDLLRALGPIAPAIETNSIAFKAYIHSSKETINKKLYQFPNCPNAERYFQYILSSMTKIINQLQFEQQMSILTGDSLAEQVTEYLTELENIQKQLSSKDERTPNLSLLRQKINIKIINFQTTIKHLRLNASPPTSLKQLSRHLAQQFSQIIKETHRLLQMPASKEGCSRMNGKLAVLKQMQRQMNEGWEGRQSRGGGLLKKIDENTSMLARNIDQKELRSIAKECLQKEFLAIRMAAYQMYQQYSAHSHSEFYQRIQDIYGQHSQLSKEINELKEINKDLKREERNLTAQLKELKTMNELISKRYFETGPERKSEQ